MDDEVIPDSSSECVTPPNTVLLRALKKLNDETVPSFIWQIPSHPSEPRSENSGCDSDSSATYCSGLENVMCDDSSGHREACDNQNRMQATQRATFLMETDTQEMNDNSIISITMEKNDCLIRVDDDKNSFSNSPIIQDLTADWSQLINSVINDDDINNTLLAVADTLNNDDISLSINNEAVTSANFTIEDMVSFCNAQIPQGMAHPHSTAFEADSVAMSTDMFANLSFDTEHKDCNSKNSSDAYEEDAFINKSIQPTTDYETVEILKSNFQVLNDASTDSPCESSPDKIDTETMVKNIIRDKKTERKTRCNEPDGRSLKFQVLCSATVEREGQNSHSNTNEFRSSEGFHAKEVDTDATKRKGTFPKGGKFKNGHQKKITKQGRCQSKRKSSRENIHGSRKEKLKEGKTYRNCVNTGPPITRTKTGSLPSGSTTFTQSKTAPRRPYTSNVKHRIRDRMSEIQEEVRAWLRGWGPPLNKARAHKLIAEVQGMLKNISSESSDCGSLKKHEVEEISQVSEKLLHQLQSVLTAPELQEDTVTDKSLECKSCYCCTDLGTETDTSNEMFSPGSDDSEIMQSEDSSVALHMIQEMTLTDDKTVGENSTTKSPEIHNINNSACYDVQTDNDTCWEHTNDSLHHGRTHKALVGSLDKIKQSNTKKFTTTVKQVHFAPSGQELPLQSSVHAEHLTEVSHVVVSQTDTQSTYFSNDTNLQATYSTQIESLSHTPVYTKRTDGSSNHQIQMQSNTKSTSNHQIQKQSNAKSTSNHQIQMQSNTKSTSNHQIQKQSNTKSTSNHQIQKQPNAMSTSNHQIQMQSNAKSTSDPQHNEIQLNVHSKLNRQKNIQSTAHMNENTNEISNIPNCESNLKQCTCDLPHLTGTRQKRTTNSSGSYGKNVIMNVQSSMEPPDETCSLPFGNPLQMSNTTDGHNDRNGEQMESSKAIENPAEIIVSELNNKRSTEKSQSAVNSIIRHKVDSRATVMSSDRSQTVQNVSNSSVTSTNEKQMENVQSLSILQGLTAESQCSDQFGLTQSMLTQMEGSFIFGIKKIWLHSASEYVPNYELPEGFWINKTTPFPKDLLQALEDY